MGRLYSGNLNEYRDARERLNDLDLHVIGDVRQHFATRCIIATLKVVTRSGATLAEKEFSDHDEDIMFLEMAHWLRIMHDQLRHWK